MLQFKTVTCYADAYDLTDPKQAKKVERMQNARKRFGRSSNGKQTKLVKFTSPFVYLDK